MVFTLHVHQHVHACCHSQSKVPWLGSVQCHAVRQPSRPPPLSLHYNSACAYPSLSLMVSLSALVVSLVTLMVITSSHAPTYSHTARLPADCCSPGLNCRKINMREWKRHLTSPGILNGECKANLTLPEISNPPKRGCLVGSLVAFASQDSTNNASKGSPNLAECRRCRRLVAIKPLVLKTIYHSANLY